MAYSIKTFLFYLSFRPSSDFLRTHFLCRTDSFQTSFTSIRYKHDRQACNYKILYSCCFTTLSQGLSE